MHHRVWLMAILSVVILACDSGSAQNSVNITLDGVFLLNGKPVFPIGFSEAPPVDAVTPDGRADTPNWRRMGPCSVAAGPPTEGLLLKQGWIMCSTAPPRPDCSAPSTSPT